MDTRQLTGPVRLFLSRFDDRLTADLAAVVRTPLLPGAELIDLQIDLDDAAFSLVGFQMDRSASQHGNFFPLRDADLTWPTDITDALANDDDDLTAERAVVRELVAWLADVWASGGGIAAGVPAYACRHDDLESYDLAARQWVNDSEVKWA